MSTPSPAPARSRSSAVDLALVAAFAALVAVCSMLPAINISALVPITLQTFAVILAAQVLGARRAVLAILLWLGLGLTGLPVFANGRSGLAVMAGPSAGYIVGFVGAALVVGLAAQALARSGRVTRVPWLLAAGLLGSLVNHVCGITGMHLRAGLGWAEAAKVDVMFWPGDLVKNVASALVAAAVHRAFPWLLDRRG